MTLNNKNQIFLRGRYFTSSDLATIEKCVHDYYDKGRTFISKAICRELNWTQTNGWLKDRACRDVLIKLHEMEYIELPPPKKETHTNQSLKNHSKSLPKNKYITSYTMHEFPENVSLVFAKGNYEEKLWNRLVVENHYLGHKVIVGRCIKYLVLSEKKVLGAISFSSPAWRLEPRDKLLASFGISPSDAHNIVINNSRFLIMPEAKIKNFASYILSLSTKTIITDWENYYSIRPLFVETFVQPSRFLGTCYKAANWLEVGVTKGYAKSGSSYHNSQEPKKIFLYGLTRQSRSQLFRAFQKK